MRKLVKKVEKHNMKDKKENKEAKVYVASTQPTQVKVKIEDTVQDQFAMTPRKKSRVKKNKEEVAPQVVVEISKDRQGDKQNHGKEEEMKGPEVMQSEQEEDIAQLEQRANILYANYEEKMEKK